MSWSRERSLWRRTDVRLTLWYAAALLATLALTCAFLGYRLHKHLIKQADAVLMDEAKEVQALLARFPHLDWIEEFKAELGGRTSLRIHFRLLDQDGREVASWSRPGFPWSTPSLEAQQWRRSGQYQARVLEWRSLPYREVTVRVNGLQGPLYLQISTDLKQLRNAMGNFYRNVLILVPVAMLLSAGGGWLLARRSLSTIGEIATTASRISSQNLGERLRARGTGDELDDLVHTINSMLDRLDRSFGEIRRFSADVAHELRTPLCAMRGECELLLSRPHSSEDYREALERFAEQFDRLNRLANDLLLLARFEAKPSLCGRGRVDLGELLRGLGELFDALAEHGGVQFRVCAEKSIHVSGDRALLQQAFSNLVHNAIQYTRPGGEVAVSLEEDGSWAVVSVRDTGVGIPAEDLPHVFKRFYRVEKSRSRHTGGSGLGLSIAKRVVEVHGGSIQIQSRSGHGTNVEVRLPRIHEDASG